MSTANHTPLAVPKKAREALNDALDSLLGNLVVVDGVTDFSQFHAIAELAKKLAEHEPWKSHIRAWDLFEVIEFNIQKLELERSKEPTKVAAKINAERFKQFRDDVRAYLLSLPRQFDVIVELPSMPHWGQGEIKFTNSITLIERAPKASKLSETLGSITLAAIAALDQQREPVVLKIRSCGYGCGRVNTTAVLAAISQLKQFFQMFRRIGPYQPNWGLSSALRGADVKARVVDPEYPDVVMEIELPEELQAFLSKVSIDEDKLHHYDYSKGILTAAAQKAETREQKVTALLPSIAWIAKVMDCPTDWPDADRLRSALEWGFDSAENDNETFAFIQACIGLEALLGDDDKEEPLTARLADRCAYLLGTTHKDRTSIRKRFKQMYDVRSKVIHGRSPRLNHSDSLELHAAQSILGDVITAEAKILLRALEKPEK